MRVFVGEEVMLSESIVSRVDEEVAVADADSEDVPSFVDVSEEVEDIVADWVNAIVRPRQSARIRSSEEPRHACLPIAVGVLARRSSQEQHYGRKTVTKTKRKIKSKGKRKFPVMLRCGECCGECG